jgi:serine/threonine protein kinase
MLPIPPDTLLQQRYRILNMLGEGEFGRTYLATDRSRSDAYCAIEEIVPSSQFPTIVAKAKELFKQEATLLTQLQHLQVPHFWTVIEEQSRLLLVRDYIVGKTYGHLLAERRDSDSTFSESEVWQFLLQILPVIGYIHSKGVIHRDLSPDNIVLRESDRLPVPIDFGIVKEFALKLQANPDQRALSVRQPGYAPAEQIRTGQVYPNSDLYSLGVTAIVLLTGKEPSALFEGDVISWGWRKWTQVGDEFANILSRMLQLQPADRYQSAIEVERDLQSISIPNSRSAASSEAPDHRPSTIPTVVVGSKESTPDPDRGQSAITHISSKSMWEKPQVFIPLGIIISLLAGLGSWFGVTQLLHRQPDEPVATTPPKQIDFNNPTIPNDPNNPNSTENEVIQTQIDRPIVKEGKIDNNTPIRYKFAAVAGQNLDIQLIAATTPSVAATKSPLPTNDPTRSTPSPGSTLNPSPTPITDPKSKNNNLPIAVPAPLAATQVLMTIMSPMGTPIDQADRVVGWRGQLSESGDYTIELRPIKGLAGNAFPYKLSITQLAAIPSPSPSPTDPNTPSTGSTPPLGIPIPIGGAGIDAVPANPNTNQPGKNNSVPTISPAPVPIDIPTDLPRNQPTESERPARNRKSNRSRVEPTPQIENRDRGASEEDKPAPRRRKRIESDREETPPPRRRNRKAESNNEESPTPRSRNRQNNSDTKPKSTPTSDPDLNNLPASTPKSEPTKTPAPTGENSTSSPTKTNPDANPPLGTETIDPD